MLNRRDRIRNKLKKAIDNEQDIQTIKTIQPEDKYEPKKFNNFLVNFVSKPSGICLFVIFGFIAFNILFFIGSQTVRIIIMKKKVQREFCDNISNTCFENLKFEKIDLVYTWVNGSDPKHKELLYETKMKILGKNGDNSTDPPPFPKEVISTNRFQDNQELRYSLRSAQMNAPWIHHIYIVTNGQIPNWLDLSNPKITVIPHEKIFRNLSHLPTFSSPAIESNIHTIPNLSEKFIYCNDDFFFFSKVWPDDFFTSLGQKVSLAWPIPDLPFGCLQNWIGDGFCDIACNVSEYNWDGGDCLHNNSNTSSTPSSPSRYTPRTPINFDYCTKGCLNSWMSDNFCDRACDNYECAYDGGDCNIENVTNNLFGINLTWGKKSFYVTKKFPSMYINITSLFKRGKALKVTFSNSELIRTATNSQKHKTIFLTFFNKNITETVEFKIIGDILDKHMEKKFNITFLKDESMNESDISNEKENFWIGKLIENEKTNQKEMDKIDFGNSSMEINLTPYDENEYQLTDKYSRLIPDQELKEINEAEENIKENDVSFSTQRKLLDTFIESLRFVNDLYNKEYKVEERRVPAHVPHLIDKKVMIRLQNHWSEQFDLTSSRQFRSPKNMQYQFSYYYYLIHEPLEFNMTEFFNNFLDRNQNGVLEENELRILAAFLSDKVSDLFWKQFKMLFNRGDDNDLLCNYMKIIGYPESRSNQTSSYYSQYSQRVELKIIPINQNQNQNENQNQNQNQIENQNQNQNEIQNQNENQNENQNQIENQNQNQNQNQNEKFKYFFSKENFNREYEPISLETLFECENLMDLIEKRYSTKKNNLYEMREENEAVQGFVMVYSEIKDTREKLDEVIRNRPKFMCLNDDKNYSHPEAELVTEEVAEFLELFFPFPSQFELKDGETNQFLYLDEMIEFENQTTNQKKNHLIWLFIILIILIFVTPLVVVKIIRKNRNNLPIRVWKV